MVSFRDGIDDDLWLLPTVSKLKRLAPQLSSTVRNKRDLAGGIEKQAEPCGRESFGRKQITSTW